jgi:hypothetical protein
MEIKNEEGRMKKQTLIRWEAEMFLHFRFCLLHLGETGNFCKVSGNLLPATPASCPEGYVARRGETGLLEFIPEKPAIFDSGTTAAQQSRA